MGLGVAGVRCGFERVLDGCGDPLGDPELVDHPRDDQATAVDVERGGIAVPLEGARSLTPRLTA